MVSVWLLISLGLDQNGLLMLKHCYYQISNGVEQTEVSHYGNEIPLKGGLALLEILQTGQLPC